MTTSASNTPTGSPSIDIPATLVRALSGASTEESAQSSSGEVRLSRFPFGAVRPETAARMSAPIQAAGSLFRSGMGFLPSIAGPGSRLRAFAAGIARLMAGQDVREVDTALEWRALIRNSSVVAASAFWLLSVSGVIGPPAEAYPLMKLAWLYWTFFSLAGVTVTVAGFVLATVGAQFLRIRKRKL